MSQDIWEDSIFINELFSGKKKVEFGSQLKKCCKASIQAMSADKQCQNHCSHPKSQHAKQTCTEFLNTTGCLTFVKEVS